MGYGKILMVAALVTGLAGCMGIPREMTVAEYCANPRKANENVCRLKVEIDGTSTALAATDMRLSEARSIADNALAAAGRAQTTADGAQSTAGQALARAEAAMNKREQVVCETVTVQKSNTGTCRPGYALTSCTQTRFTYRSGGPSILREINDQQCRFNDRVLEMQVRCCGTASASPTPVNAVVTGRSTPAPTTEVSPLRY
jgi:hypothetical protein